MAPTTTRTSSTLSSSYDKEGLRTGMSGKLWKLNDKGLLKGSRPWKCRWASSDGVTIDVWASEERNGQPKYSLSLFNCIVEEHHYYPNRKHVFTVHSKDKGTSGLRLTLSSDNVMDYEEWVSFLTRFTEMGDDEDDEGTQVDGYEGGEIEEESTEDLQMKFIKNFFSRHNVSSSHINPIISVKNLEELLVEISGVQTTEQTDLIMKYFFRRTGMVAQLVSLEDFLEFLDVFQNRTAMTLSSTALPSSLTGKEEQDVKTSLGNHYSENSFTLGIVDPILRSIDMTPSMVMLMRAEIPNVKNISMVEGPPASSPVYMNGHSYWNDKYQRLLKEVSKTNSMEDGVESDGDHQDRKEDDNKDKTSDEEDDEDREPTKGEILDNVSACLQLAAFQGAFLHTAVEGAHIIVDEYTLPDKFKSTHVLHHHHHSVDKEQSEKNVETEFQNVEIQSSSGTSAHDTLSFSDFDEAAAKPIAVSLSDYYKRQIGNDSPATASHKSKDFDNEISFSSSEGSSVNQAEDIDGSENGPTTRKAKDDQVHIDADHIYKGLIFSVVACKPDPNVDRVPTEQRLKQLAATDVILHKSTSNEHRGALAFQHVLGKSPQKSMLCSALSTFVDYGGFRVHVMCPLSLSEDSAVLGGPAEEPNMHVEGLLSDLLNRMNIDSLSETATNTTGDLFESSGPQQTGHVFPDGVEVHVDENGDDYVINLAHLLPMEIPRPHTSDIQTRRIRPEFLSKYPHKFKTDCMTTVQVDEADSLVGGGDSHEEKQSGAMHDIIAAADGRAAVAKAKPLLQAMGRFYTSALPDLVRALDSLSTLPFDSYSLSQCFHSYGAGMHHMGTVYSMSKSRTVRRLILSEAVARSCKVIVNNILRQILRKEKANATVAEMRERSEKNDYVEHMNDVQRQKEERLLDFFNLVFGSSQESSTFWRSTLPDAVYQKFSLVVPSSLQALNKAQFMHLPQLFLAMQYHIGIQFLDHCKYPFEQPLDKPFTRNDVIHFFLPAAKSLSHSNNQVLSAGYVGFLDAIAESFLGADLPNEATRLFRLRLSLQLSSACKYTSHKSAKSIALTSYKLALALYTQGDYEAAVKAIDADMAQRPRYTALNGRFLTLLMSCHFLNGNLSKAMEAFDAGTVVYNYSLGPHHPIQAIHMDVLADLYRMSGNYKHCSLMLTMACEVSEQTNGDSHVTTARYTYKIAANSYALAYNGDKEYRSLHLENALDLFQEALSVYQSIETSGADVKAEILNCMYAIVVITKDLRRIDDAMDRLEEAEDFIKSTYLVGDLDSRDLAIIPLVAISTLSLLVDFLMRRNECKRALATIKIIRKSVLSRPSHFFDIHEIIAKLSCKILSLLLSSQTYATRNLINVICEEVESADEPGYGVDALDAWSNARAQVLVGMLQEDPETFFASIVEGLLKGEIEANNAKEPTKGRRRSTIAVTASSFALQMAVIVRLARSV